MTEPERAALDHIRRVVDSVIGAGVVPDTLPVETQPPILPVPYVSQLGEDSDEYVNDSGAAAGAMLARAYGEQELTAKDFYLKSGQTGDAPLSFPQVASTLKLLGVACETRDNLKLADLSLVLFSGRPVVTQIRQTVLQEAGLTPESFDGPHFIVVVGMDIRQVYIHDPLRMDASGQAQAIPWLTFYNAWAQADRQEKSILVPRQQLIRRVQVTVTSLNIYGQPNASTDPVGTAISGELFEITTQNNGWGKIGEDRWISLSYTADI